MNISENKRGMPDKNGIETTREIAKKDPDVCISILFMHKNSGYLNHSVSAGAKGYLLKEIIDDIFSAIDAIKAGGVCLPANWKNDV